jgi:replicative DNA helicase
MSDDYDLDAERSVLGALLTTPSLVSRLPLDTHHFHPRHQPILLAIRAALSAHGESAEADQVVRELAKREKLAGVGGAPYVFECVQHRALPANLRWYAEAIEAATVRRKCKELGTSLVQKAGSAGDTDDLLSMLGETYTALAELMDVGVASEPPINGLSSVEDFLNEPVEPYRWVIPGILEHTDRCVITAGEGVGKSVLARQLALLLAGGRHPFLPRYHVPPKRTLLVDLENPPSLVRRNMRGLYAPLTANGLQTEGRCWRWNEPDGIDIRTTAGYRQLERVMEQTNPDLLCIGPVYKMSNAHGDKYEVEAHEVQQAIGRLRNKFGCAFFMEHHAAKGSGGERSGDPFGSSYWMRWPEFGLSLVRARDAEANVYNLGRFRGDRDVRYWPDQLVKGAHPLVPWSPMWDDLEQEHLLTTACQEAMERA